MTTNAFFQEQLEDQQESWKVDYDSAMECRDVEDLLRKGIGWFYIIRISDESWSRKVQDGHDAFNPATVRQINAAYKWWLGPCEYVLGLVQNMERSYQVEGAEEFRRCYRHAKNLASTDVESLIESAEQYARGEVSELTEEDWGGLQTSQNH